jgi:hypothetical protein
MAQKTPDPAVSSRSPGSARTLAVIPDYSDLRPLIRGSIHAAVAPQPGPINRTTFFGDRREGLLRRDQAELESPWTNIRLPDDTAEDLRLGFTGAASSTIVIAGPPARALFALSRLRTLPSHPSPTFVPRLFQPSFQSRLRSRFWLVLFPPTLPPIHTYTVLPCAARACPNAARAS